MARVLFTDRTGPGAPAAGAGAGPSGGTSSGPWASFNLSDTVGDDPAAVADNRSRAAAGLGAGVAWMHQVHGSRVVTLDAVPGQPLDDVDALVTATPGVGLGVLVADCVPVVLVAPTAVGVAHAGRRGLAGGVLVAALDALRDLGAEPADVVVHLGPAVCGRCYEVPEQMRAEVDSVAPGSACTTRAGTAGLDLRAGLARQAASAGVRDVRADPRCTVETPALFSYRRDRTTGRSAGLVVL